MKRNWTNPLQHTLENIYVSTPYKLINVVQDLRVQIRNIY